MKEINRQTVIMEDDYEIIIKGKDRYQKLLFNDTRRNITCRNCTINTLFCNMVL